MEKEDISSQEGRKYEQPARERAREPSQGDLKTENNDPKNDNDNDNSNNNGDGNSNSNGNGNNKEDSEESRKRARAREKKLEKVRRKKEEKARARAKGKMGIVVLHEDLIGEEFWERKGEGVFEVLGG